MKQYVYTGNASFEDAYHDCKLVDESIVDDKSFQKSDTGLVLYYMDRILEALGKQVAKKPNTEQKDIYGEAVHKCPTCFSFAIVDYCSQCGQKIDWSGE